MQQWVNITSTSDLTSILCLLFHPESMYFAFTCDHVCTQFKCYKYTFLTSSQMIYLRFNSSSSSCLCESHFSRIHNWSIGQTFHSRREQISKIFAAAGFELFIQMRQCHENNQITTRYSFR